MTAFRFTTAGESHGPGLTAIVEGMPAGLRARPRGARPRHGAPPARPRPRRPDADRDRHRRGPLRRPPRPHARQPDRAAGRQPRLQELGRPDEPLAGRGLRAGRGPPAAARPRRPGRRPEVRPLRHPQHPRARQRPRDRRPRRRRRRRPRLPHRARGRGPQPRHPDRLGRRGGARRADPGRLRRRRRRPGPHPRPGGLEGDGRRDQPPAEGQREPRRHLRGDRLRARPRARLPRLLGRPARRPARPGGLLDPVDQGRLDRRSVGRRDPPRLGSPRRDLLVGEATATSAKPTAPAASRAG